jgi:hypothetical protein
MAKWVGSRGVWGQLSQLAAVVALVGFSLVAAAPVEAQIHGIPPSVTSIPNHVPPYLPNAPASVTSLGPYGYCCQRPSNIPYRNPAFPNRYNRRGYRGSYGYGYGSTYAVPYYVYPADNSMDYSGSSGGGPYLYSAPPQGPAPPAEQTLHIIVDTAPTHAVPKDEIVEEQPKPSPPPPAPQEVKPGVPTVLVFRDGHTQEVTNYAIMGPTVYVFDKLPKKIALADLDVPATVKANDDQGVEFQVPKASQSAKPAKSVPAPQSAPAESPTASSGVAKATP